MDPPTATSAIQTLNGSRAHGVERRESEREREGEGEPEGGRGHRLVADS